MLWKLSVWRFCVHCCHLVFRMDLWVFIFCAQIILVWYFCFDYFSQFCFFLSCRFLGKTQEMAHTSHRNCHTLHHSFLCLHSNGREKGWKKEERKGKTKIRQHATIFATKLKFYNSEDINLVLQFSDDHINHFAKIFIS